MVMLLLSASVEKFSVSHTRHLKKKKSKLFYQIRLRPSFFLFLFFKTQQTT